LQTAKVLVSQQNKVIICGRSNEKLEEAKALVPELIYECDISELENRRKLATWIAAEHPKRIIEFERKTSKLSFRVYV
jgi:uncharacterized oxidoreductase